MAAQRHNAAFIVGAILGGITGAAVTLWTTPRSGLELRGQMMGQGDDYAPGVPASDASSTTGATGEPSLGDRALGVVERVAAPIVGVRLGEQRTETAATAASGTDATAATADASSSGDDEEILVPVGTASGEPAPGDSGPGHVASTDELSSPVEGALETQEEPESESTHFTPFPQDEEPPNPPR